MIEVINERRVFSFDGRVLEALSTDGSTRRFHIAHIRKIEIAEFYNIWRLNMEYTDLKSVIRIDVDSDSKSLTEMQALVDAVIAAMVSL